MTRSRLSNLIAVAIIAAVAAMVTIANWREARRNRASHTSGPVMGSPGAPRTSREELERRIREMDARMQQRPDDAGAAMLLADALLRQTRVTGNPGLAVRAEQVLEHVLVDDPASYEANRMLGALYLSQHRFRQAVEVGEKNRVARPYDPVNYGVIGDGYLELGEYDAAFAAFDRMMALRPSAAAYARVAYARELRGNLSGALEAMKLAADATSPEDLEGLAWAHSQTGDLYFQLGRFHEAKSEYSTASRAFPGHPFAVMGYARVIAEEGDLNGAVTLLHGLAEKSPTPDLAARTGDLLERLGRHEEAERQYALAETGWRVDAPEPKNLARFLADRGRKLDEAVQIAETAASGRHDIFTEDALAWACYKAGRLADARQAIAQALRTGTKDRTILMHAAAIRTVESMPQPTQRVATR